MKKVSTIVTIIAFHFCLLQSCEKEEIEINNTIEFEEYIKEEMEFQNIPAMSILIFEESNVLYEGYFGKSNIDQNTSLQKDDIFLLASISKVVTATALLQLFDDGLFELDDKINDYLPFNVFVPNQSTPITFRMLLTHTSGIADGSALDSQYYYGRDSPIALESFLKDYLDQGGQYYNTSENFHKFEPGTQYEYSNIGSALIGVLVEQISNKAFNSYCKENIFYPLEMTHTFWSLEEAIQSNNSIVQPYNYVKNQFEAIQHYTFTDYPNGGLRSSVQDMHKLLMAFVQEGNSNNYQLLNSSTINSMIKPQIPSIDDEVGLHMFIMDPDNGLWGHDGGEAGVATIMAFSPISKVGALIFVNQGDAELEEILSEAYKLGLKI
ncbi:MAG: beta-lactamase family protein [Bacteroidia bacterium]